MIESLSEVMLFIYYICKVLNEVIVLFKKDINDYINGNLELKLDKKLFESIFGVGDVVVN